jgi:uncharacterized membrane protein
MVWYPSLILVSGLFLFFYIPGRYWYKVLGIFFLISLVARKKKQKKKKKNSPAQLPFTLLAFSKWFSSS